MEDKDFKLVIGISNKITSNWLVDIYEDNIKLVGGYI